MAASIPNSTDNPNATKQAATSAQEQHHVITARNLSCGYDGKPVAGPLSFTLESGEVKYLLGPNGAGKTTLFKTLLGFITPCTGSLLFDDEDMSGWDRRKYGQMFGYIPQEHEAAFPFTVLEFVLMGRTPHLGAMQTAGKRDEEAALAALRELGMESFANRDYTQLSGGERQMVLVARVLAQQPAFLVMDEPTSALDMGNQARVLNMAQQLAGRGFGVLMTTHDPNQALLLNNQVICLTRDGNCCSGRAQDVLTQERLSTLYGCPVVTGSLEDNGQSYHVCIPAVSNGAASREDKQ